MSRGLIAERARLSLFVVRRGLRALRGRVAGHRLLRWRFAATVTDRLLIAPQDLRTADPTRASEIYAGRFTFAGKVVVCDGRSPFSVLPPTAEWAEELESFGWLRHLRAAESSLTRSNARALVEDWIASRPQTHTIGWRPEVVGHRLVAWLMHAPFILNEADARFYKRFLRSLGRQVHFLLRMTPALRPGLPRLQATIALNYAALCMSARPRLARVAGRRLNEELQQQILPDGGHVSRNPGVLLDLLLELLPLRQAYGARDLPPPAALINAIDRMMPMLRFFRHGDGAFAHFNGMGPTSPDLLATVLAYDDARGRPVENASHSGYQRLEASGVVLLMDSGRPPPLALSQEAHAGCLAFEFSARRHRVVVGTGLPSTGRDAWRHLARRTQAHSTVTVADTSSCRFLEAPRLQRLIGTVVMAGPTQVRVEREQEHDLLRLRASHDGYAARFGILHERSVALASDGSRIDGEDVLRPARGDYFSRRGEDEFAVRFHLHPAVQASRLTHRNGAMLMLPNREVWIFEAHDHKAELEESVYLAGPHGPRATVQLVIHGHARDTARVQWSFVRADPNETGANRPPEEPELPL
ncbi:MAG TPA: heparinase II/III family protein [Xanthobacteraceae bacterium]